MFIPISVKNSAEPLLMVQEGVISQRTMKEVFNIIVEDNYKRLTLKLKEIQNDK